MLGDAASILFLMLLDCESVDCWSVISGAICLQLKRSVLFEYSGWMNEVFIPLRKMKEARAVGDLLVGLKRTRSNRSKSVTDGSLTFRPSSSSIGVFPRGLDAFRCFIKALCNIGLNVTFRFGLQAIITRFTAWAARSASPFALGWQMDDSIFLITRDPHHCFRSMLTNSGQLSANNVSGIPNLAKNWLM